jgi:hypothetical protein
MAKTKEEPKVEQPNINAQLLYMSMKNNEADEVKILRTNKTYQIRWLKNGQLDKLTSLLLRKDGKKERPSDDDIMSVIMEDRKLACKAAAIIILDGYWKLKFRYWFLWRWFYYIKQYDDIQLQPLLETGKKKVPLMQFYMTITSLTEAKDSLMRMRKEEAEATLLAQSTAQPSQTENKDSGS